jgi:DNA-binding IclR family transcriptional regulator
VSSGFAILPRWVLFETDLSEHARMVLLVLTAFVNSQSQECWPSHATIAKGGGMSAPTVKRALNDLRDAGLVTWEPRFDHESGQTSNVYRLHLLLVDQTEPPRGSR